MVKDHLGNAYSTTKEMCDRYHISAQAFNSRIKRGMDLQEALTTPLSENAKRHRWHDHLGCAYKSKAEMCKTYDIPVSVFNSRIRSGYGLERALTEPYERADVPIFQDHLGNIYNNEDEMCKAYGINRNTYRSRLGRGWSIEKALTDHVDKVQRTGKVCTDHLGNKYASISEMCRHYNIPNKTFKDRIKAGWGLEEALVTSPLKDSKSKIVKDHTGKIYRSITVMCKAYNISISTYMTRIKAGWSLEKALKTRV